MAGSRRAGQAQLVAACALAAAAALATATSAPAQEPTPTVEADYFTLATPPTLAPGQIELTTLSTTPSTVTGGEVLVGVRGLAEHDTLTVQVNGTPAAGPFETASGGERRGLVTGLRDGDNRISAAATGPAGHRVATLAVRNHPITGPVISGPHQEPFYCESDEAGLGPPLDEDCSVATKIQWFWRSRLGRFSELADPYGPYPGETATTTTSDGREVPFVVRVESATINRGIARIAVLDDPAARGPDAPFSPVSWNRRLTYAFGESCGVGYRQGVNHPETVLGGLPSSIDGDNIFSQVYGLTDRLSEGDVVAHSTLTTFGVHCNPLLSPETMMMVKEHVIEEYGVVERTVSVGGSGGALQQYNATNNYPGLIDGAIPVASFTDIPSTAMTVVDCGLLASYFERTEMEYDDDEKAAVSGHITSRICPDWVDTFLSRLDPARGCNGEIPREVRYHPQARPNGVRCTLQDSVVHQVGRDPETGFARRAYDNTGVQYGLNALNARAITIEQFVDINREVGGYDIDGKPQPQRNSMPDDLARLTYELGAIVGRGAIRRTPIIDLATYLDLIPVADIHDVIRPFQVRDRLQRRLGDDSTQRIWRGVSIPMDAQAAMGAWLDGIDREAGGDHQPATVSAARPEAAGDRCIISAAGTRVDPFDQIVGPLGLVEVELPGGGTTSIGVGTSIPEQQSVSSGVCEIAFPAVSGTRIVAGGPLSDDVIKCALKPVDAGDYAVPVTAAQLDALREIFSTGVCDWSEPGVGEVERSKVWTSLGDGTGAAVRSFRQTGDPLPATSVTWTAARSTTAATGSQDAGQDDDGAPAPSGRDGATGGGSGAGGTGGGLPVTGLELLLLALLAAAALGAGAALRRSLSASRHRDG